MPFPVRMPIPSQLEWKLKSYGADHMTASRLFKDSIFQATTPHEPVKWCTSQNFCKIFAKTTPRLWAKNKIGEAKRELMTPDRTRGASWVPKPLWAKDEVCSSPLQYPLVVILLVPFDRTEWFIEPGPLSAQNARSVINHQEQPASGALRILRNNSETIYRKLCPIFSLQKTFQRFHF